MKLLKAQRDALSALMMRGAGGPEELAEDLAKELDRLRSERDYHYAVIRHLAGFVILGPFATSGQAAKAGAKHPAAISVTVVPGYTGEGLDRLIAETDAPPAPTVDPLVTEDAKLFKLGWKGKRADRNLYVQRLELQ